MTKSIAEQLLTEQRQVADMRRSALGNYAYPLNHWFEQNNALREMVSGHLDRTDLLGTLGNPFSVSSVDFIAPILRDSGQLLKHQYAFDDLLQRFTGRDIFDAFSSNAIGQDVARLCELNGGAHSVLAALSNLGRYDNLFGEYEALTASTRELTLPSLDYDFSGRLGDVFSVRELLNFRRSDDAQRYLEHTDLPSNFVTASPRLIRAACIDLGVLQPLPRRQVKRSGDRQLKKIQVDRSLNELQRLLQWLENALREKVDRVMTERIGADWTRATKNETVSRWVKLYDKKKRSALHPSFIPLRVVDASQFSDLMRFAFLSDECAEHILAFDSISDEETQAEISWVIEARNSLAHGYLRVDEHAFGIVRGIVVKLAGLAGLITPGNDSIDLDANDD